MVALRTVDKRTRDVVAASYIVPDLQTAVLESKRVRCVVVHLPLLTVVRRVDTRIAVYNALDARATSIQIFVNLDDASFSVADNGDGIDQEALYDFVGECPASSRVNGDDSDGHDQFFGYRGEFLHSVASLAASVEIKSRHVDGQLSHQKLFQRGEAIKRDRSSGDRSVPGTTVNVRELFALLPVRQRSISHDHKNQTAVVRQIQNAIVITSLLWPFVTFELKLNDTLARSISLPRVDNFERRVSSVFGDTLAKQMQSVLVDIPDCSSSIQGCFATIPDEWGTASPGIKQAKTYYQFLFCGKRWIEEYHQVFAEVVTEKFVTSGDGVPIFVLNISTHGAQHPFDQSTSSLASLANIFADTMCEQRDKSGEALSEIVEFGIETSANDMAVSNAKDQANAIHPVALRETLTTYHVAARSTTHDLSSDVFEYDNSDEFGPDMNHEDCSMDELIDYDTEYLLHNGQDQPERCDDFDSQDQNNDRSARAYDLMDLQRDADYISTFAARLRKFEELEVADEDECYSCHACGVMNSFNVKRDYLSEHQPVNDLQLDHLAAFDDWTGRCSSHCGDSQQSQRSQRIDDAEDVFFRSTALRAVQNDLSEDAQLCVEQQPECVESSNDVSTNHQSSPLQSYGSNDLAEPAADWVKDVQVAQEPGSSDSEYLTRSDPLLIASSPEPSNKESGLVETPAAVTSAYFSSSSSTKIAKLQYAKLTVEPMKAFAHKAQVASVEHLTIQRHKSIKLHKSVLDNMRLVRQVDRKFIIVSVERAQDEGDNLLLCIDQHAADERVRLENLEADLFGVDGNDRNFEVHEYDPPLILLMNNNERRTMERYDVLIRSWGFRVEICPQTEWVSDKRVEKAETSCGRFLLRQAPMIEKRIANADDFREFVQALSSTETNATLSAMRPPVITRLLHSRACRSAIMFGDFLSTGQCETLLEDLRHCQLPFQCAHGRPSIVPLAQFHELATVETSD